MTTTCGLSPAQALAQRAVGIDVSAWQGTIDWATVAKPVAQGGGGKQFAFIRSSRGGTTGFYNQSDPNNTLGQNTLSQRYDDPFFASNMAQATSRGMFAGPYHFARGDILSYVIEGQTVTHTGLDEANHFLEQAGNYMKPGYLRPVLDLEAGAAQRSRTDLSNFALAFINRIYEVKGVYPIVYINSSYANDEIDSRVAQNTDLWIARWPNQADPNSIDIQNINPPAASGYPNVYGVWNPTYPNTPTPHPWDFWQYASTGQVPGIGGNVDLNVANGNIEFVKDFLVPALWTTDANGSWSDATKWNSNPGLPGVNDRVIINRPAAAVTVTLAGGTHGVRSLQSHEAFLMTDGTLNVQQHARFLAAATISGGNLTAASLENAVALNQAGGAIAIAGDVTGSGQMNLSGGSLTARRVLQQSVSLSPGAHLRLDASGVTSVSVINQLLPTGGQVDIGDEALVVNYTGLSSPATLLRTALVTGYAGGSWTGDGINSRVAADDAAGRTAVGFAEATDVGSPPSFLGQPIDDTAVLIRHTLYGDANLSGSVDLADFAVVAANFNADAPRWSLGDFNYDGTTNLGDFSLLAANFNQSLASTAATQSRPGAVPEPAMGLTGLTVAITLLSRRR